MKRLANRRLDVGDEGWIVDAVDYDREAFTHHPATQQCSCPILPGCVTLRYGGTYWHRAAIGSHLKVFNPATDRGHNKTLTTISTIYRMLNDLKPEISQT